MLEHVYNPQTGAIISQRGSLLPGDMLQPDANRPGASFTDAWFGEAQRLTDPHDQAYETGMGSPATGAIPDNIVTGDGPFSKSRH